MTPEQFKSIWDRIFTGNPSEARSFCEEVLNPNYVRLEAGSDRTDFERAVEKITFFRQNCTKINSSLLFFACDNKKIAARLIFDLAMGDEEEKKLEVMIMVELDDEEKWVAAWELITPYLG
ncbi:flavin containing amine oxidoreductase family protein [Aspergillus tubingensis]|uniref:flavin containing amine oxidoreductase family protein n=1 Tax=Aspergillus tubingensis TaxID=5068 RepID=UPI001578ECEB|nr:flavin containing amine oxidoreductase family protein [Aspergillus tubingensis]GFN20888.1 flavin containing amine oxidoreductase family protein [Aspergillus tubingensis]